VSDSSVVSSGERQANCGRGRVLGVADVFHIFQHIRVAFDLSWREGGEKTGQRENQTEEQQREMRCQKKGNK
jgi:hypothetical protein